MPGVDVKTDTTFFRDFRCLLKIVPRDGSWPSYLLRAGGFGMALPHDEGASLFNAMEALAARQPGLRSIKFTHGASPYDSDVVGVAAGCVLVRDGNAFDTDDKRYVLSLR